MSNNLSNLIKVSEIVEKHFGLESGSLKFFKKQIINPTLDPVYSRILGLSDDLRVYWKVGEEKLEKFDKGWPLFCQHFKRFIDKYDVEYKHFRNNKIDVGSNQIKIGKALVNFYEETESARINDLCVSAKENVKRSINQNLEKIGTCKLSKSGLTLVLTFNFADWLLCSTAENWESCLKLSSSFNYWIGLPGLVGDKNRAMIYITSGKKKEYFGIEVDKIDSRSWVLLDKKNNINVVRFYPKHMLDSKYITEITGIKFKDLGTSFVSKHKVNILFFKTGQSAFIYQDSTCFNKLYLKYGNDGNHWFHKAFPDKMRSGSVFDFEKGLEYLIQKGIDITQYRAIRCARCGSRVSENSEFSYDNSYYCENCFRQLFVKCSDCSKLIPRKYVIFTVEHNIICEECADKNYILCSICEEFDKKEHSISHNGKDYCSLCKSRIPGMAICKKCDKLFDEGFLTFIFTDNIDLCEVCLKKEAEKYTPTLDFGEELANAM